MCWEDHIQYVVEIHKKQGPLNIRGVESLGGMRPQASSQFYRINKHTIKVGVKKWTNLQGHNLDKILGDGRLGSQLSLLGLSGQQRYQEARASWTSLVGAVSILSPAEPLSPRKALVCV